MASVRLTTHLCNSIINSLDNDLRKYRRDAETIKDPVITKLVMSTMYPAEELERVSNLIMEFPGWVSMEYNCSVTMASYTGLAARPVSVNLPFRKADGPYQVGPLEHIKHPELTERLREIVIPLERNNNDITVVRKIVFRVLRQEGCTSLQHALIKLPLIWKYVPLEARQKYKPTKRVTTAKANAMVLTDDEATSLARLRIGT